MPRSLWLNVAVQVSEPFPEAPSLPSPPVLPLRRSPQRPISMPRPQQHKLSAWPQGDMDDSVAD